jgi:hypothetical protein
LTGRRSRAPLGRRGFDPLGDRHRETKPARQRLRGTRAPPAEPIRRRQPTQLSFSFASPFLSSACPSPPWPWRPMSPQCVMLLTCEYMSSAALITFEFDS